MILGGKYAFLIMFTSTILLSVVTEASALDILFETVSATATVGLSRNLTGYLNTAGKLIIIGTMYLGRVGKKKTIEMLWFYSQSVSLCKKEFKIYMQSRFLDLL